MKNPLEIVFSWISETINGGERAVLDALSAIVPYTTASIPAYLTYMHTLTNMNFPDYIAGLAAFTVEVLGVTSVSTAIRFFQWNKNHSNEKEKAPFVLAVATYVFYILITLSVNVILEIYAATRAPAVIWAIGLFSLLSLPSGVLISVRAQFGEMLEDKREKAEVRKAERAATRKPGVNVPAQGLPLQPMTTFNRDVESVELQEAGKSNKRRYKRRE